MIAIGDLRPGDSIWFNRSGVNCGTVLWVVVTQGFATIELEDGARSTVPLCAVFGWQRKPAAAQVRVIDPLGSLR